MSLNMNLDKMSVQKVENLIIFSKNTIKYYHLLSIITPYHMKQPKNQLIEKLSKFPMIACPAVFTGRYRQKMLSSIFFETLKKLSKT
jgi:hypothetical protein